MSKISKERKVTYYIGLGIMALGFILFISVFFFAFSAISNRDPFANPFFDDPPPFINAVIGIVLIIVGSIVTNIGARGVAGSGLKLDPDKAREDLKPFNEARGKMINDVISNIDAVDNITKPQTSKEIVKIRCKACNCLNDEDAKFCKDCGSPI